MLEHRCRHRHQARPAGHSSTLACGRTVGKLDVGATRCGGWISGFVVLTPSSLTLIHPASRNASGFVDPGCTVSFSRSGDLPSNRQEDETRGCYQWHGMACDFTSAALR